MAVLKGKDKKGNITTISAIQGTSGKTYIFTEVEENEIKNRALDSMQQAEEMML